MAKFKQYHKGAFGTMIANQNNQPFFGPAQQRLGQEMSVSLFNVPAPKIYKSPFGISATLYFIKDVSFLDTANFEAVKYLADEIGLIAHPNVLVEGHASEEGNPEHNQQLSESRKNAVIATLKASKSIGQPTFSGIGCGSMSPAVEETGVTEPELENQRRMNRRVEVVVLYPPGRVKLDEKADKSNVLTTGWPVFLNDIPEDLKKKWMEDDRIRNMFSALPAYQSLDDLISRKVSNELREMGVKGIYNKAFTYAIGAAFNWGKGKALDAIFDTTDLSKGDRETIKKMLDGISDADIIPEKK